MLKGIESRLQMNFYHHFKLFSVLFSIAKIYELHNRYLYSIEKNSFRKDETEEKEGKKIEKKKTEKKEKRMRLLKIFACRRWMNE